MLVFYWIGLVALFSAVAYPLSIMLRYLPRASGALAEMPWLPDELHEGIEGFAAESEPQPEEVTLVTEDKLRLGATYFPTPRSKRKGVIIFCHELRGSRWSAIPYVRELRRWGFDVLTFDFRNHGNSDRLSSYEPLPWATSCELFDLRAAIDYCCTHRGAEGQLGLFGLSRGATSALCAAADDRRVMAVVADGFVPTERVQDYMVRRFMNIYVPRIPETSKLATVCLPIFVKWVRLAIQWRQKRLLARPEQAVRRLRQPVLLIHGMRDAYVPFELVRAVYQLMPLSTRLWLVPKAKHNANVVVGGEAYQRRVVRFFDRYLPPEDCSSKKEGRRTRHFRPRRRFLQRRRPSSLIAS